MMTLTNATSLETRGPEEEMDYCMNPSALIVDWLVAKCAEGYLILSAEVGGEGQGLEELSAISIPTNKVMLPRALKQEHLCSLLRQKC